MIWYDIYLDEPDSGSFVAGLDHEGNLGVFLYHHYLGFIPIASNPMAPVLEWTPVWLNTRNGDFLYADLSPITEEEIYGEEITYG